MSRFHTLDRWFDSLDWRSLGGVVFVAMCLLAAAVFGFLPHTGLAIVNAFLSGFVLVICLLVLLLGGKRVDLMSTTGAALIAGGLATSIPSVFYDHATPVDWGSSLSRIGLLLLMLRWSYEIARRWREENGR